MGNNIVSSFITTNEKFNNLADIMWYSVLQLESISIVNDVDFYLLNKVDNTIFWEVNRRVYNLISGKMKNNFKHINYSVYLNSSNLV